MLVVTDLTHIDAHFYLAVLPSVSTTCLPAGAIGLSLNAPLHVMPAVRDPMLNFGRAQIRSSI